MASDQPAQFQLPLSAAEEEKRKLEVIKAHHLPIGGAFPYIPPKHWRSHQPLRKNSKGEYIDTHGYRWRKGPSRTDAEDWEWDVQLPNDDHLNIDWLGNITHPKPKARPVAHPHKGGGTGRKGRDRKK